MLLRKMLIEAVPSSAIPNDMASSDLHGIHTIDYGVGTLSLTMTPECALRLAESRAGQAVHAYNVAKVRFGVLDTATEDAADAFKKLQKRSKRSRSVRSERNPKLRRVDGQLKVATLAVQACHNCLSNARNTAYEGWGRVAREMSSARTAERRAREDCTMAASADDAGGIVGEGDWLQPVSGK